MPSYRGHLMGGLVTFAALAQLHTFGKIPGQTTILIFIGELIATLLGSLFPDIDTKSRGRRYFNYFIVAAIGIAILQRSLYLIGFFSILWIFQFIVPHRGVTHNPLFLVVAPIFMVKTAAPHAPWLSALPMRYYFFFVAGALSHIILDFLPHKVWGIRIKPKQKQFKKHR
jgi:uncharacterized metal-binding protein